MKLIFKEVGQGDSIILHWQENRKDRVILVDCNLKEDGTNPTLIFLQTLHLERIELIVLSHPHTDHFSGLNQVLEYSRSSHIKIGALVHTCMTTTPFLLQAVKGQVANTALKRLLHTIVSQVNDGHIILHGSIDQATREFEITKGWKLQFLAPFLEDYGEYNSGLYKYLDQGTINRGDANLLSTVIKIYKGNRYLLLTSDATRIVLDKILQREPTLQAPRQQLLLIQVSHHGSKDNYHPDFMKQLKPSPNTPAVISVGQNDYKHPCENMKAAMRKLGYVIYETNFPANSATVTTRTRSKLALISSLVSTPTKTRVCQDQSFEF